MTKVYELPNEHRMVADIDESTRVCNITETLLDSLVSKLNYYAEQTDMLDKIRAEIQSEQNDILWRYNDYDDGRSEALEWVLEVIDKYTGVRE